MTDLGAWLQVVEQRIQGCSRVLLSVEQMDAAVVDLLKESGCPFIAIRFRIQPIAPFGSFDVGAEGSGEPTDVRSVPELDALGTTARISLWGHPAGTRLSRNETSRVSDALVRLTNSFWKGDLRNATSHLISKDNSEREHLIDNTLRDGAIGLPCALLYCDLDNFKSVNDQLGHPEGDRIIREFAVLVTQAAGRSGVPVHRSGDEFLLLVPCVVRHGPLIIARQLHALVHDHEFRTGDVQIGAKVGIAIVDQITDDTTYTAVEKLAENATSYQGEKQRGRARLAIPSELPAVPTIKVESLELALVLVKSAALSAQPFASPWLNLISEVLFQATRTPAVDKTFNSDALTGLLSWMQPTYEDGSLAAALAVDDSIPLPPLFSHMDVALSVAHAYLRVFAQRETSPASSLAIRYTTDHAAGALLVNPSGQVLYRWGPPVDHSGLFDLGAVWNCSAPDRVSSECCRRAILVKIGHEELAIPARAFANVIVVDDRPTRGGGLPDFWESTIARLVSCVESNPNISTACLLGNVLHASLIAEKLKEPGKWRQDAETLSFRTGTPRTSVIAVSNRLDGSVFQANSEFALLPHLAELYRTDHTLQPITDLTEATRGRFLDRHLDASKFSLGIEDGVRARSIAEAFPLVLEISRKADGGLRIVDQAGQQLYELVDFKVHLSDPSTEMVPAFYKDDVPSLDKYFTTQFLQPEGLYGRYFQAKGYEAAVVHHVASSITNARPFHTRRGVLVVPHDIQLGQELTPLGLISVRIIPRSLASRRIMNYSFTWRTVEALIGFPYSIYGSVKYAQHLTDQIRSALPRELGTTVECGFVSYLAHSLHFFLDRYAQNIARRIVEDASE
jgi:diguanylate cyclase (GGDEF)-like protein